MKKKIDKIDKEVFGKCVEEILNAKATFMIETGDEANVILVPNDFHSYDENINWFGCKLIFNPNVEEMIAFRV